MNCASLSKTPHAKKTKQIFNNVRQQKGGDEKADQPTKLFVEMAGAQI